MTAVTEQELVVAAPGVYDLPEDVYHRDPVPTGSLSASGAKRLLPPSCPAIFRWEQLHGRPNKRTFDFGHAAHAEVLGIGAPLVVVDAEDWRTKAAREQRDEAYTAGHVPILTAEHEQVRAMAAALRQHPTAAALFDPEHGKPETSLFWTDPETGVMRRARLDWLPNQRGGHLVVADYKTTVCAEPDAFARTAAKLGYHIQATFYTDGLQALGLAEDVTFLFVAQEKTPPYLVSVFELDAEALLLGRTRVRQALKTYAECVATDTWPGYSPDVQSLSLPGWATYDLDMVI